MSILTIPGVDVIRITEDNLNTYTLTTQKIHLIRLDFESPDVPKMETVIRLFKKTNRFIIDTSNIKFYNYYFKQTNLKYYVINTTKYYAGIVSFFKRNNKILLDIPTLNPIEKSFVLNSLYDILSNTEVVIIDRVDYDKCIDIFDPWRGNVIIRDTKYEI